MRFLLITSALSFLCLANAGYASDQVPKLDVKGSCHAAQAYGDNKAIAFKGCMDDETQAYEQLKTKWAHYKPRDRQDCVDQVAHLIPSYVEVLTCLEMSDDLKNIGTTEGFGAVPSNPNGQGSDPKGVPAPGQ
jgi:hypothetical protein